MHMKHIHTFSIQIMHTAFDTNCILYNLDCDYSSPIDLAPNGILFGIKLIVKLTCNPNLV